MLQIPVVTQSRVPAVQTVQKPEIPQRSSWTVPKTVEVPQLQLVQFFHTPVVLVTTGACAGPDSAEIRGVSARVIGLGSLPVVVQRQVPDG